MKFKFVHLKKAPYILCATLFFLLFFGPLLKKWEAIPVLLCGLSGKMIATRKVKRYFTIFFGCLLASILIIAIAYVVGFLGTPDHTILTWVVVHISIISFLVLYAIEGVAELMSSRKTNFTEVIGALNAYLIFGLIYGEIYALIAQFRPNAFAMTERVSRALTNTPSLEGNWNYIYFSFVTQTSVGYGDITPVSHLAQVIAITQAIFGQFYIAIVLAYLLRNYITTEQEEFLKRPDSISATRRLK